MIRLLIAPWALLAIAPAAAQTAPAYSGSHAFAGVGGSVDRDVSAHAGTLNRAGGDPSLDIGRCVATRDPSGAAALRAAWAAGGPVAMPLKRLSSGFFDCRHRFGAGALTTADRLRIMRRVWQDAPSPLG